MNTSRATNEKLFMAILFMVNWIYCTNGFAAKSMLLFLSMSNDNSLKNNNVSLLCI